MQQIVAQCVANFCKLLRVLCASSFEMHRENYIFQTEFIEITHVLINHEMKI